MNHAYKITGMTCKNCEEKITNALLSIRGVSDVKIDRDNDTSIVSMTSHVKTIAMQEVLKEIGDYQIEIDTKVSTYPVKKEKII